MPRQISKSGDKKYERNIFVELAYYCRKELNLDNAQIGRIFNRHRSVINRTLDGYKPKGA